jgi:hypothetical protein
LGLAKQSTDINRTLRYLTHSAAANEVHEMRMSLIDMFGEEELNQVIYLAFLETINRFDPARGVPLEKFIYNYYPYILETEINNIASPRQMLNSTSVNKPNAPNEDWYSDVHTEKDGLPSPGHFEFFEDVEIDYRWIDGETCGEPFICLTPLERKLLVMIYVDKATHEEIGDVMGYHFSSIKRKKNEILGKLQQHLEELSGQVGKRL